MRFLAWFQIVVGAGMAGFWIVVVLAGQVPELDVGQRDILFHLTAELLTAAVLVTAGLMLLRGVSTRARTLSAFALGALLYTAINSPGYYADLGEWAMVAMFAALAVTTAAVFLRVLVVPARTLDRAHVGDVGAGAARDQAADLGGTTGREPRGSRSAGTPPGPTTG